MSDAALYFCLGGFGFCLGFVCGAVVFQLLAWAEAWRIRSDKATLRELAEKHGMDFDAAGDQQEQIDMETGKRFTLE